MKLSDIRARDNCGAVDWDWAVADRRELLKKLDIQREYMRHSEGCSAPFGYPCKCGLDAALKEIEGENNG